MQESCFPHELDLDGQHNPVLANSHIRQICSGWHDHLHCDSTEIQSYCLLSLAHGSKIVDADCQHLSMVSNDLFGFSFPQLYRYIAKVKKKFIIVLKAEDFIWEIIILCRF